MIRSILPMLTAIWMIWAGWAFSRPATAQEIDPCLPTHIWHAPACGHEHGDPPPGWIADAGYTAAFDQHGGFHGNTSPAENTTKHTSMKGILATFGAQQAYIRLHWASNVMERSSRYHSYEVFLRDDQGGISHWQGWTNTGSPNPADGQRRSKSLPDNGVRPTILVADYDALVLGRNCEQWYAFTSSWGWDLGLTICDSTTMYFSEESQYPDYWVRLCDYGYPRPYCVGADREVEASWYGPDSRVAPNRGNPPKDVTFYATQFGEIVSGPDSPRCSGMTERFGVGYPNICLSQYITSTARAVENPGNRTRKVFDVTGVTVPN